jgi:uncharacterized protein YbjQ (UPF0145 family)
MEIKPGLAALILALFLLPLGAKFYLAGQQAQYIVGNYYLSDARDGSLFLQIDNHLFKADPATRTAQELKPAAPGFSARSQLAMFSNGDALLRLGEWDTDIGLYLNMADVSTSSDNQVQQSLDQMADQRAANVSSEGSQLARCKLASGQCQAFHPTDHKYQHNYNLRIHPEDDSVFITEGLVHKISHYTPSGELISEYSRDLRYPKRVELHPDGSLYFANSNRHRIERIGTAPVIRQGHTFNTMGSAGKAVAVDAGVTGDSTYQWPLAVKFFANQWWVINMDGGMRRGRLFHFGEDGSFKGQWPLPDYAQPLNLLVFDGQLLISDASTGVIHRVDSGGKALSPWGISAASDIALPKHEKLQRLEQLNSLMSWWIALLIFVLIIVAVRSSIKNRKSSLPGEIRPTFSVLDSGDRHMLISNIEVIPNKRVVRHLGLVQGSTVRAKHAGRDIMAGFKNIFGGELAGYTELLQESREEAVARMSEQAQAIGANAVINVRFSTSAIAAGASEILAYGTAVQVTDT